MLDLPHGLLIKRSHAKTYGIGDIDAGTDKYQLEGCFCDQLENGMFTSLKQIRHPLIRSATAAITTLSVATFASSVALGVTNTKDESAVRSALYASLLAGGCGALFGLMAREQEADRGMAQALDSEPPTAVNSMSISPVNWTDWRNFVVVRKVKESKEITSFYLRPEDMGVLPSFQPGQFLTIKLEIPGQARVIIRTYSLSDYAE